MIGYELTKHQPDFKVIIEKLDLFPFLSLEKFCLQWIEKISLEKLGKRIRKTMFGENVKINKGIENRKRNQTEIQSRKV